MTSQGNTRPQVATDPLADIWAELGIAPTDARGRRGGAGFAHGIQVHCTVVAGRAGGH
jgi:hypothetical protein